MWSLPKMLPRVGIARRVAVRRKPADLAFTLLALEGFFGGFYVAVSRGVTPVFLVYMGYDLRNLLLLNAFAGTLGLVAAVALYRHVGRRGAALKGRMLAAMAVERALWFSIPWVAGPAVPTALVYGLAFASTIPTGIYMSAAFLKGFEERRYRRLMAYRVMLSSAAAVLGQGLTVTVLAFGEGMWKYVTLYIAAFAVSLVSLLLVGAAPIRSIVVRAEEAVVRGEEEVEAEASNTYILFVMVLSSTSLLSIAWVPHVMRDLGAPDYLAAMIGFMQTLTNIFASWFWAERSFRTYRYAFLLLASVPILVYLTPYPLAQVGIAVLYGFSLVGANLFTSFAYSRVVKHLGVIRAATLLTSAYALALTVASLVGYALVFNTALVFAAATAFSVGALAVGLTTLKELAVIPPSHVRLYARILYHSSVASYNYVMMAAESSVKAALKTAALIAVLAILFIIYKTLYYLVILTR